MKQILVVANKEITSIYKTVIFYENIASIYLIQKAKTKYPNYDYYYWNASDIVIPENLTEKIVCKINMPVPVTKISAVNMKNAKPIIHQSYLIPSNMVDRLQLEYEKILQEWQKINFNDIEENLFYQIYINNKNIFQLVSNIGTHILLSHRYEINQLINIMNLKGKFIEIGVYKGEFSEYLLNNTNTEKLYLIDPYKNFNIEDYTDAINNHDMEKNYQLALEKVSKFTNRFEFIKKTSDSAIELFADDSIDFVYIDGNHAYQYVYNDLENYWKKVKPGGILMGDDLILEAEDKEVYRFWDGVNDINKSTSFGIYGVKAAFMDFVKKYNLKYYLFSNQFLIIKN